MNQNAIPSTKQLEIEEYNLINHYINESMKLDEKWRITKFLSKFNFINIFK